MGEMSQSNLEKTYELTQYQANVIHHLDNIVNRMSDLAYEATDFMATDTMRKTLDSEFQAYSGALREALFHQKFGFPLFDPLASKFIDANDFPEPEDGGQAKKEVAFDIGALAAKIKLWWRPMSLRDRIQFFQGKDLVFDSGAYRNHGTWPYNKHLLDDKDNPGTQREQTADYFEIDYEPGKTIVEADLDNSGDSEQYADGYTTGTTKGDSTVLKAVVNEANDDWGFNPSANTAWDLWWEIEKKPVTGPMGIMGDSGELMELQPVGFSTLEGLSLRDRLSASDALEKTSQELENLQYQIGILAKSFSELRLRSDFVEDKSYKQSVSLSRIADSDVAVESTELAKNLILKEATSHALIHSRLSAENVMNLLL